MVRFGGNEFLNFSVPLSVGGRYFIFEPGDPPLISIVREVEGAPVFELLKNVPVDNPFSEVSELGGRVAVSDKTEKFQYKVRPHSETSIVFGTIDSDEVSVRITDKKIQVGGNTIENNLFTGTQVGVVVGADGSVVGIGVPLSPALLRWFNS